MKKNILVLLFVLFSGYIYAHRGTSGCIQFFIIDKVLEMRDFQSISTIKTEDLLSIDVTSLEFDIAAYYNKNDSSTCYKKQNTIEKLYARIDADLNKSNDKSTIYYINGKLVDFDLLKSFTSNIILKPIIAYVIIENCTNCNEFLVDDISNGLVLIYTE